MCVNHGGNARPPIILHTVPKARRNPSDLHVILPVLSSCATILQLSRITCSAPESAMASRLYTNTHSHVYSCHDASMWNQNSTHTITLSKLTINLIIQS